MYRYNNQEGNNESAYYYHTNNQYSQLPPDSSFDELPTQILNNQQLETNDYSLFDMNHNNWDLYNFEQPELVIDPQEAILFSDPNFIRQHQLLQEEQKEMHTRLQQDEHDYNTPTKQETTLPPLKTDMTEDKQKQQPRPPQQSQQQQKRTNRRQQVFGKSTHDDEKIDHQRRFNELQARFRVNYARKPTQHQSSQNKTKRISTPAPKEPSTETPSHQRIAPPNRIELPPSKLSPSPSVLTTPPIPGGMVMNKNGEELVTTKESLSSSFPSRTMPIQIHRVSRGSGASHFDAESYQKQLDHQLDKVDFNDITVSELKEMLRQRGKPATGKKAILLQRLQEERELAKGGRSPMSNRMNRHSQPLPISQYSGHVEKQRPNSFQASSSPIMVQQRDDTQPIIASPSLSTHLPPVSPGGQLNRSIANMHIGSPPTSSRRYSPYSPRLGSSPKHSYFEYSSSVPSMSDNMPTSPSHVSPVQNGHTNTSNAGGMMLSSSYSARLTPGRYFNNTKSYKPFTSSALATPDRDEDINPFDVYYAGGVDPPIKEEESTSYNENSEFFNYHHTMDPITLDTMLKQGAITIDAASQPIYTDDVILSNEQIMAILNSQQQAAAQNFKLDDSGFNPHYYQHH